MPSTEVSELLRKINVVGNESDWSSVVNMLRTIDRPFIVSFVNQHGLNLAFKHSSFRSALNESDILFRDGIGIEVALKLIGIDPGLNMNGTDTIPKILSACANKSIAVFGTNEPWLSKSCDVFISNGFKVSASADGFKSKEYYLDVVSKFNPDIVLLAMGMPKQEMVARFIYDNYSSPCLIINGGAILDFVSGRVTRAPSLMRRYKLEWLYRLSREPGRLANRYLIGGFLFIFRVGKLAVYNLNVMTTKP